MTAARTNALQRFASRYASFAAARIALVIGRWFVLVQSARHLDAVEFAALAAALSAAEILRALSDGGVDSFTYSRLGRAGHPLRITVRAALLLRLSLSLVIAGLAAIVIMRVGIQLQLLPVLALIPATAMQSTSVALLQKEAQFGAMAVLVAGTLLASLAVDWLAYSQAPKLAAMALLLVTPDIAAAVIAAALASPQVLALSRQALRRRRSLQHQLRAVAGKLMPAAAVSILVIAYSRLDVAIVRPLAGSIEQAHYSAGFRLIEPAFMLFAIASLALLAELGAGQTNDVRHVATRLLKLPRTALLLGFPALAAVSATVAVTIALHVIGLTPEASYLAGIFAAAVPFRIANSMLSALLLRFGRFDAVMHAALFNGGITFSFAIALVTIFGAAGAATAALLGEIFNTAYQRLRLRRQLENSAPGTVRLTTAVPNTSARATTPPAA